MKKLKKRAQRVEGEESEPESERALGEPSSSSSSTVSKHINFFEEIEREEEKNREEHDELLKKQRKNNELAGVGKKVALSEFNEVTKDIPWYAKPSTEILRGIPAEVPETSSEKLSITPGQHEGSSSTPTKPEKLSICPISDSDSDSGRKVKKSKKKKKEKKEKTSKKEKKVKKAEEEDDVKARMRREREEREARERGKLKSLGLFER